MVSFIENVVAIEVIDFDSLVKDRSNKLKELAEDIRCQYKYTTEKDLNNFLILLFNKANLEQNQLLTLQSYTNSLIR